MLRLNTTISEGSYLKIKRQGFQYPSLENQAYIGKHILYDGQEWIIGGCTSGKSVSIPAKVLSQGMWLPTILELLQWLEYCEFVYTFSFGYDENGYDVYECAALDSKTKTKFTASSSTMEFAIVKLISKIVRSKEREYLPQEPEGYEIIDEYDESKLLE